MKRLVGGIVVSSLFFLLAPPALAGPSLDPEGDFIATYVGPHNPGLDVLSTEVVFNPYTNMLRFEATMAGPVLSNLATEPIEERGIYVWGIDQGAGTAVAGFFHPPFTTAGVILDQVLFNQVLVVRVGGTPPRAGALVNVLDETTLIVDVPLASFTVPSGAKPVTEWGFNLWPRTAVVTGDLAISDFAPDNANIRARVATPEPATTVGLALGLVLVVAHARWSRRRRASIMS